MSAAAIEQAMLCVLCGTRHPLQGDGWSLWGMVGFAPGTATCRDVDTCNARATRVRCDGCGFTGAEVEYQLCGCSDGAGCFMSTFDCTDRAACDYRKAIQIRWREGYDPNPLFWWWHLHTEGSCA